MITRVDKPRLIKIVCYSPTVLKFAHGLGWFGGASYVRLRDIRNIETIGLIDIDWRNYDFKKHLAAVKRYRPLITVANDVVRAADLNRTLDQANELMQWAGDVVIVPKDTRLGPDLSYLIPNKFILGYSVPTKFGGTQIPLDCFRTRRVHLLGGRPDVQRKLASSLNVISLDVNRFTLDARYGDFFDGEIFRPHPIGGYHRCIEDSIRNIETLWLGYRYVRRRSNTFRHQKSKNSRSARRQEIGVR